MCFRRCATARMRRGAASGIVPQQQAGYGGCLVQQQFQQRRHRATQRDEVSDDEWQHLNQELPPREMLSKMRSKDNAPHDVEGEGMKVPGDSFGIMRNRSAFMRPVQRPLHTSAELAELMPPGIDPRLYVNPIVLRRLCGQYGITMEKAVTLFRECSGDINAVVKALLTEKQRIGSAPFGSFALVAMESYTPETFCFVNFAVASFEATQSEEVLEAMHEIVLSAAEIPMDTPAKDLVAKLNDWTTEDGTRCGDLMQQHDIAATDVLMLPHGEYSVQGFCVLNPLDALGFPNIGTGVAACCLDLRTGIHKRFRFHVERMADSISDHVLQELLRVGQQDHLLRQPYWFNPEYSVEEFIRFKETLLQPSASVFEMRYGVMLASSHGLPFYRNIVELEKLKVAQHKYEKHYEDVTTPGSYLTSDQSQLQTVASGGGGSNTAGTHMHRETNSKSAVDNAMETRTGALTGTLKDSMLRHGDRVFGRFYRNNFY